MKNDQKFRAGRATRRDATRRERVEGARRVVVSAIDCPSPLLPAARRPERGGKIMRYYGKRSGQKAVIN